MSITCDGQICFGVPVEEPPWNQVDDVEDWWLQEKGFKPPFELYDSEGEYIGEPSEEDIDAYYDALKTYPMPVDIVIYGSFEYPEWIVAIPSTV